VVATPTVSDIVVTLKKKTSKASVGQEVLQSDMKACRQLTNSGRRPAGADGEFRNAWVSDQTSSPVLYYEQDAVDKIDRKEELKSG
jgi:hypothetical protein